MNILLVFATEQEAGCLAGYYEASKKHFNTGLHNVSVLVTGVGSVATAWSMKKWLQTNGTPDLAINTGIAGSFKEELRPGEVVMPVSDCFADLGIETATGFIPLKDTPFMNADEFPFTGGQIICSNEFSEMALNILKPVRGITLNTVSGSGATVEKYRSLYSPDIETMEGAAFFYVCSVEHIPFIAVRAISNKVGCCDKNKWDINLALTKLSEKIIRLLSIIKY